MPPTPRRVLVDRILNGRLTDILKDWRSEGLSFGAISRRLASSHGVDVSDETVRKWCGEFEMAA